MWAETLQMVLTHSPCFTIRAGPQLYKDGVLCAENASHASKLVEQVMSWHELLRAVVP